MSKESVLSSFVLNLNESETLKMSQMARDLKAKGKDVISLSIGEPDFDTPEFVIQAAKDALDRGYTHYTPVPGLMEYREAIVKKLKRDNGLDYTVKNIVVSNGAKQSISNICQAFLNPGDEVIIFAPYWVSYFEMVKMAGGVPICLDAAVETDFKVTAQQVAAAMNDRVKFVLFSSPCNPTGSVYTGQELKEIADVIAPFQNTYIISDEIYEYIVFDGEHVSIAQNSNVFDRTVVVNGMSKGYAMTGWRLGYIAAPQFIADACAKIQGQVTSGATSFGQMAAATALLSDNAEPLKMRDIFLKRRDMVLTELRKIDGLKLNIPQGAFYIFPDCSNFLGKKLNGITIEDSAQLTESILEEVYVAAVSGAAFGAPNCIRLSYAASEEQLMEACRRLQTYFEKLV
jgi:aspartate aminotransferase